jgi:hypothetical protein
MSMPVASAVADDFGHGIGPHAGVQPGTGKRANCWPVVTHRLLSLELQAEPPAQ